MAFEITAGMTVCLATFWNVLDYLDSRDWNNLLDRLIRYLGKAVYSRVLQPVFSFLRPIIPCRVARCFRNGISQHGINFWMKVVRAWILAFSDQQLVSGIVILGVALLRSSANWGQMSQYHFEIATDLAWFSSNTYLATIIVIGKEYYERNALRNIRASCIGLMYILLVYVSYLEGYELWANNFNCPAECVWSQSYSWLGGDNMMWMIINIVLLTLGYGGLLIMMFESTKQRVERIVERIVDGVVHTAQNICLTLAVGSEYLALTVVSRLFFALFASLCFIVRLVYIFLSSNIFRLVENWSWFGYSLWGLNLDMNAGQGLIGPDNPEKNISGFGQLYPLLLLFLPVLAAIEQYYGGLPNSGFANLLQTY